MSSRNSEQEWERTSGEERAREREEEEEECQLPEGQATVVICGHQIRWLVSCMSSLCRSHALDCVDNLVVDVDTVAYTVALCRKTQLATVFATTTSPFMSHLALASCPNLFLALLEAGNNYLLVFVIVFTFQVWWAGGK